MLPSIFLKLPIFHFNWYFNILTFNELSSLNGSFHEIIFFTSDFFIGEFIFFNCFSTDIWLNKLKLHKEEKYISIPILRLL